MNITCNKSTSSLWIFSLLLQKHSVLFLGRFLSYPAVSLTKWGKGVGNDINKRSIITCTLHFLCFCKARILFDSFFPQKKKKTRSIEVPFNQVNSFKLLGYLFKMNDYLVGFCFYAPNRSLPIFWTTKKLQMRQWNTKKVFLWNLNVLQCQLSVLINCSCTLAALWAFRTSYCMYCMYCMYCTVLDSFDQRDCHTLQLSTVACQNGLELLHW